MKAEELVNKVIENDYCIGCGACIYHENSCFEINKTEDGTYIARKVFEDTSEINYTEICPFASSINEDILASKSFSEDKGIKYNSNEGYYLAHYIGHTNTNHRIYGSSGGMVTWILEKLLKDGYVDCIVHVGLRKSNDEPLYNYTISDTIDELRNNSSSRYYPVEMSKVLCNLKNYKKNCAIVGVPCFIKAINLIQQQDVLLDNLIKFKIGIVCGHQKSAFFAKSYAMQLNIPFESVSELNFRQKLSDRPANRYGIKLTYVENDKEKSIVKPNTDFSTTDWGLGYFKYNACEYCDDVLNETADITFGDAWLKKYNSEYLGNNIIIIRNSVLLNIFTQYSNELELIEADEDEIYLSQAGGFRHRREGLSYRLFLKQSKNEFVPPKRIQGSNKINNKRKKIYEMRETLRTTSFYAFKKSVEVNDFNVFSKIMNPLEIKYRKINKKSIFKRIYNKLKNIFMI